MACIPTSGVVTALVFSLIFCFILIVFRDIEKKNAISSMKCRQSSVGESRPWNSIEYCSPVTNVFFLKTHKCASSTVQNILMRFGDKRNLVFALPKDSNYIGHPEPFTRSSVHPKYDFYRDFNMLCHHLRLDTTQVRNVMPPDTKFITIVRNPVNLFESMYDYYNMTNHTGVPFQQFFDDRPAMMKLSKERLHGKLGRNQMLFDMGYQDPVWDNDTLVQYAIEDMDRFFDLVMVAELFEESVVLLKHELCWNMEDIVYLVHNKRRFSSTDSGYTDIAIATKNYNRADQLLYDYFLNKLNKAIDEFGREKMAKEVMELRLWNEVWFDHCVQKLATSAEGIPSQTKAYSSKVYSFILNEEPIASFCKDLAIEELQYTEKLKLKQS